MKQLYIFLVAFVLFFKSLSAQKPFICTPATIMSIPLPANTITTAKISMVNQTSGSLSLKWLKYANTIPNTWSADLCDYNTCYSGIPNMGTMSPISGLTEGFIKLEVNPFSYTGSANVVIYVYSGSAPLLGDTLIFNFTASGITDIKNDVQPQKETVSLLPEIVHIQNYEKNNLLQIIDIQGKTVLNKFIEPYTDEIIYTGSLPAGIYVIRTSNKVYKYIKP
jgi:hypothetical protein